MPIETTTDGMTIEPLHPLDTGKRAPIERAIMEAFTGKFWANRRDLVREVYASLETKGIPAQPGHVEAAMKFMKLVSRGWGNSQEITFRRWQQDAPTVIRSASFLAFVGRAALSAAHLRRT